MSRKGEQGTVSGQEWGKLTDCPVYTPVECKHGDFYWHPFGEIGFGKSYLNGEAHLLLCLRSRDGQEFLALIQRAEGNTAADLHGDANLGTHRQRTYMIQLVADDLAALETNLHRVLGANGQEKPMFVDVVQELENTETRVPSLVWAETAEGFNRLLTSSMYHSQTRHFPVIGMRPDGELGLGIDARPADQPRREIVESTPEVVENISDNQRNLNRDNRNVLDVIRYVAGFRILLGRDSAWIGLAEFRQSGLELTDVLLGPLTLRESFTIS